ncbi:MCM3 [Hepatospora eriocheir]|uniref:MCM3 n=1 Tax=Hepatospora eriocheir TaxID=1081669 RepID=A0A1X0Q512_9MICR|nr:MCM3 [Hepatospora eriocheir]
MEFIKHCMDYHMRYHLSLKQLVINSIERIKIDEVEYGNEESNIEKFILLAESLLKFKSITPTIFGHDNIKIALALQMVGGNEVKSPNGSRIIGDINILLVGSINSKKSVIKVYA